MSERGSFYLGNDDPSPVEILHAKAHSEFLLMCEHGGRKVPKCLGDLGVDRSEMDRHIAYDVGAEAVARRVASALCAPLFIQPYSRLVVDCNRPPEAADLIPEVSDGTKIPGNLGLTREEQSLRFEQIHRPFHEAVSAGLDRVTARGQQPVLLTIHSFTPIMRRTGEVREIEFCISCNRDDRLAKAMLFEVRAAYPAVNVGFNDPYPVTDMEDYAIPVHGERRGIPHVLVEVRSDLISDEAGQTKWAHIVSSTIRAAVERVKPRDAMS
ncbi:Predicted N-formylglutamate amidohydrolase [Bradyrhizobium sp. Ghvi]|uniref:N-formylglutamate amidohydrolase n=1 Tax=Bradyrhizobium sp. Ghvi TaxID=1855319 RepID=UPI0008EC9FDA|nr:N-formylglutamate amidohydrolase [Bradyrhizobium sp. Ghvi]SFQ24858.1 Predicted N-formylglutamate amidohydrolase [Bradyrhizobium sp. Ghvi]